MAVLLLGSLPLWAAPKAGAWKPYSDPSGRFSVSFPGAPKTSSQQNDSPLGKITTHICTCPVSYGSFTVSYSDLPGVAATFGEGKAFDGARDGLLKDSQASAVSYTDWQHGDDDAKILLYQSKTVQGKAWLIMVSNRLFVVDSKVKKGTPPAQVDPFFNSLKTSS